MTTIHFHYTDSYNNPSRGSLAFMPHRRHAANETEILPKPFTIPLLNGEVSVNLQPNSSSWVWIITEYFEGISKSFYTTVPDRDGVVEHTELVHISPSSIPAPYDAVEPAWWAEMRAYKDAVAETLLKSGEALTEAQQAIEIGKESVERTQYNASTAKAYAEQSREDSYESKAFRDEAKQWRDEAQEQADRAATGPESAATRAENAATRSETARDRAIASEDGARTHAAEARADATTANTAASQAVAARTEATTQADSAKSEADRAKGYADDLLAGPQEDADRAEAAQQAAELAKDQAETYAGNSQQYSLDALAYRDETQGIADVADQHRAATENVLTEVQNIEANLTPGGWTAVELLNGYTHHGGSFGQLEYRKNGSMLELQGPINNGTPGQHIFVLPVEYRPASNRRFICPVESNDYAIIQISSGGIATVLNGATGMISFANSIKLA